MPATPPAQPTRSPAPRLIAMLSSLVVAAGAILGTAPLVHALGPDQPVLTGSLQDELGCQEDWDPACEATALAATDTAGQWESTFEIPAGQFEVKATIGGSWETAYGLDGGDENIPLAVAAPTRVTFRFDEETSRLSVVLADQDGEYTGGDEELAEAPTAIPAAARSSTSCSPTGSPTATPPTTPAASRASVSTTASTPPTRASTRAVTSPGCTSGSTTSRTWG